MLCLCSDAADVVAVRQAAQYGRLRNFCALPWHQLHLTWCVRALTRLHACSTHKMQDGPR